LDLETQAILDKLDELKRAIGKGGGSNPWGSKPSSDKDKDSKPGDGGTKFDPTSSISNMFKFTKGVANNSARLSDVFAETSGIIDKLPLSDVAVGALNASKELLQLAEAGTDTWRGLAQSGASFNNSILGMQNSAAQTRMSLDAFGSLVQANSETFASLGGTVESGAKRFVSASQEMFDSGLATPMLHMGMTFEDVNEQLATNMEFNRRQIATGAISQQQLLVRTAALGTEMDKIAKLTGKNRKEMEAQINAEMRKGQVQAKIRMLEASGNKEAADKMRLALAEAEKAGPGALAAVEDLFTKGAVVSEDARTAVTALGPAFQDLEKMVRSVSDKSVSTDDFKSVSDSFNTAIAERVKDPNFLQLATLGGMGNKFADATAQLVQSAGAYADGVEAIRLEMEKERGGRVSMADAIAEQRKRAKEGQKPGDAATKTIVEGDRAMRDLSSTISRDLLGENGAITRMSNALNPVIAGLEKLDPETMQSGIDSMTSGFLSSLDANLAKYLGTQPGAVPQREITPPTASKEERDMLVKSINGIIPAMEKGATEGSIKSGKLIAKALTDEFSIKFLNKFDEYVKGTLPVHEKIAAVIESGGYEKLEEMYDKINKELGRNEAVSETRKETALATPSAKTLTDDALYGASKILPQRRDGSLGATGSLLEDFGSGTPIMAHEKEGVITAEQLENMAKCVTGVVQSMVQSTSVNVSAMQKDIKKQPKVEMPSFAGLEQAIGGLERAAKQMANNASQSGGSEIAEMLNTSLQEFNGNARKQFDVAKKQLKAQKGFGGNLFKGL